MIKDTRSHRVDHDTGCELFPDLIRTHYFHGQLLDAHDFATEQAYHRERLNLHQRCLHGYGVVCGLLVEPHPPPDDCEPRSGAEAADLEQRRDDIEAELGRLAREAAHSEEAVRERDERIAALTEKRAEVVQAMTEVRARARHTEPAAKPSTAKLSITAGLAVDCGGNDVVVPHRHAIELLAALSPADRRRIADAGEKPVELFVSICYCAQPTRPSRPVVSPACSTPVDCAFSRVRDSFTVVVSLEPPNEGDDCNPCCACPDPCCCLVLARLDGVRLDDGRLSYTGIDNGVRRMVSTHRYSTVAGVGWEHGASYPGQVLDDLFRGRGLEVRVSRPVRTETVLARGNVTLDRCTGGGGIRGLWACVSGHVTVEHPGHAYTDRFWFKVGPRPDDFDEGDQLRLTIHSDFVLDKCCRPLDGNNVGGLVPVLPDAPDPLDDQPRPALTIGVLCPHPPEHDGAWTSGVRHPGGDFVTWVFVGPDQPDPHEYSKEGALA